MVFTRDKGAMVALTGAAAGGPRDSVINPDFDFGTSIGKRERDMS